MNVWDYKESFVMGVYIFHITKRLICNGGMNVLNYKEWFMAVAAPRFLYNGGMKC